MCLIKGFQEKGSRTWGYLPSVRNPTLTPSPGLNRVPIRSQSRTRVPAEIVRRKRVPRQPIEICQEFDPILGLGQCSKSSNSAQKAESQFESPGKPRTRTGTIPSQIELRKRLHSSLDTKLSETRPHSGPSPYLLILFRFLVSVFGFLPSRTRTWTRICSPNS